MTANVTTVNLGDGRVVTLSYGVAVAVFVPAGIPTICDGEKLLYGYLKTDRTYSTTTSRHANLYARKNGSTARTVPHEVFRQLVAPIACEE